MLDESKKLILVGDNPFHGISHLSEDRARARGKQVSDAEYAAELVMDSIENGANGFMFSVSESTLSILRIVSENTHNRPIELHAIVPYAYEYVRLATQLGTLGLGRKLAGRIIRSGNFRALVYGLRGLVTVDPKSIMKTYLLYEKNRIMSSIGKKQKLSSILLQEVITDMVIALDLDWFVKSYVKFVSSLGMKPGFETRNFPFLVNKFKEWNIEFSSIEIVASFNKAGFQMNPSKECCEKALAEIPPCDVIAMSILAAGYLQLPEAIDYINNLPKLNGVVVGVSKKRHAFETFRSISHKFS
jgi:hypothetical protein